MAPPAGRHHRLVFALRPLLILCAGGPICLHAQFLNEYEVKAAFLFKFASFVEWPSEFARSPVCITIIGQDPFGPALDDALKGKIINGRQFLIRRAKSEQDAAGCHIAFISTSEKAHVRAILDRLQTSTLTVSDIPNFCGSGGMIDLETVAQSVRMEINQEAAERAGLRLSSKLLSVSRIVRRGDR